MRLRGKILLACTSLALTLLLMELSLSVFSHFYYPRLAVSDPVLGWKYRPTRKQVERHEAGSKNRLFINREGFRDDEFLTGEGVFRIMLLGDSFTFGSRADQADIFAHQLEEKLRRTLGGPIDVMNFGIPGFGTAQELLCLKEFQPRYRPHVVLLAMLGSNDFENNLTIFNQGHFVPHFVLEHGELKLHDRQSFWRKTSSFLRDHSVLYYLATNRLAFVRSWLKQTHDAGEEEKQELTFRILEEIRRLTVNRGIPLYLFYIRDPRHGAARYAALQSFADQQGIPLQMLPLVAEQVVPGDGHWNADGHAAAAEIIYKTLTADPRFFRAAKEALAE